MDKDKIAKVLSEILRIVSEKERYKLKNLHIKFDENGFQVLDYNHDWICRFRTLEEFETKYSVILK